MTASALWQLQQQQQQLLLITAGAASSTWRRFARRRGCNIAHRIAPFRLEGGHRVLGQQSSLDRSVLHLCQSWPQHGCPTSHDLAITHGRNTVAREAMTSRSLWSRRNPGLARARHDSLPLADKLLWQQHPCGLIPWQSEPCVPSLLGP